MKGLRLFGRTSGWGCVNLASYHSPHSATWRWFLSFSLFRADELRFWPLFWSRRSHENLLCWGFRLPMIGVVSFQQQRPMWYRDLYMRLSDEQAQREGRLWLHDAHPHKIRDLPPLPAEPIFDGPATLQ